MAEETARAGLKHNTKKYKTLRTECDSRRDNIVVDGEEVDDVEELTYLGAMVDKEGEGNKDVMHRLQKACGVFQTLRRLGQPEE